MARIPQGWAVMNELEEARMLREALDALDDSISIYEADGSHIYSSRSARRRFATFYRAMDYGLGHWEAMREAVVQLSPHLDSKAVDSYVDWCRSKFESGETYPTTTDDGRNVLVTYRTLSSGRKAGISIDVTSL